jgi:heme A synthase
MGWIEWMATVAQIVHGTLFQRLYARHLPPRLPLPDLSAHNCIVTGATSGIGLETAKYEHEHTLLLLRCIVVFEAFSCYFGLDWIGLI